ncbi:HEPN domain-containing protein [Streptomyces sp. NPDC006335]|uniref:ApeA N-terminal domain 1-containing protein n=1 Tax=Streptomyces sp. NPDC006335 TaxID=3156895 RepID=UPI0033BC6F98
MSDKQKLPLNLIYEPETYLCSWLVPNEAGDEREIPGDLTLRPLHRPTGQIYGDVPLQHTEHSPGVISTSFPQEINFPILHGRLANGGSVILLDAHIQLWDKVGLITGAAALLGKPAFFGLADISGAPAVAAPPDVTSATFQITALDAALGVAPIKNVSHPNHPDGEQDRWAATVNANAAGTWSTEDAELTVSYYQRMRALDPCEFNLAFSPVATVKLSDPKPLEVTLNQYIEPLRKILSIATGKPQELSYLHVELEGRENKYQVFGTGITQSPFASSTTAIKAHNSVIRALPDGLSLLDLVTQWSRYAAEHHPLVETYGAMLHARDQHPRSRYLLLIQAMEGLYGYENKASDEQRQATHTVNYKVALAQAKNDLDAETFKFVKKYLSKKPSVSLDTALDALLTGLPVNLMDQLSATDLVKEVQAADTTDLTTAGALRVVRNNLAHGNRGYDPYRLHEVVRLLEFIVRGHALRILGCPEPVISRVSPAE